MPPSDIHLRGPPKTFLKHSPATSSIHINLSGSRSKDTLDIVPLVQATALATTNPSESLVVSTYQSAQGRPFNNTFSSRLVESSGFGRPSSFNAVTRCAQHASLSYHLSTRRDNEGHWSKSVPPRLGRVAASHFSPPRINKRPQERSSCASTRPRKQARMEEDGKESGPVRYINHVEFARLSSSHSSAARHRYLILTCSPRLPPSPSSPLRLSLPTRRSASMLASSTALQQLLPPLDALHSQLKQYSTYPQCFLPKV